MRVAVTGASGFVGRHVCRALLAAGLQVRGVSRGGPDRLVAGVEFAAIRALDHAPDMERALGGVDVVVHLAARVHVMRETAADPLSRFREANVMGTRHVLESMKRSGVRRLILASSVKAVGERSSAPWSERVEARPQDPYGISKHEAERTALEWAREDGADAWVLRLPLVYGPGVRANFLRLLQAVRRGMPIPVPSTKNRRSLLCVGNLAYVIASLAASPAVPAARLLHVADCRSVSTSELARAMGEALGRRARLVPIPLPLLRGAGLLGDLISPFWSGPLSSATVDRLTGSLELDTTLLETVLGHPLPFNLEEGLARTAAWLRDGVGA